MNSLEKLDDVRDKLLACPGCGGDHLKIESNQNNVTSCEDCGLIFNNPRPNDEFIQRNYCEGGYYANFMPDDKWVLMWRKRIARVQKYLKRGRVLDISAGVGTSIQTLKAAGFDASGTEISTEAIAKAKSLYNIDLQRCYPDDLVCEDESLDALMMWHVFEHLPFPGHTLKNLAKKIKTDGYLFIAVPNNSLQKLIFKPKYWFSSRKEKIEALVPDAPYKETFDEIHLIHFTPESLKAIVEQAGFKVVELTLDNVTVNPSVFKVVKHKIRCLLAQSFGLYAHEALFLCAKKI